MKRGRVGALLALRRGPMHVVASQGWTGGKRTIGIRPGDRALFARLSCAPNRDMPWRPLWRMTCAAVGSSSAYLATASEAYRQCTGYFLGRAFLRGLSVFCEVFPGALVILNKEICPWSLDKVADSRNFYGSLFCHATTVLSLPSRILTIKALAPLAKRRPPCPPGTARSGPPIGAAPQRQPIIVTARFCISPTVASAAAGFA